MWCRILWKGDLRSVKHGYVREEHLRPHGRVLRPAEALMLCRMTLHGYVSNDRMMRTAHPSL